MTPALIYSVQFQGYFFPPQFNLLYLQKYDFTQSSYTEGFFIIIIIIIIISSPSSEWNKLSSKQKWNRLHGSSWRVRVGWGVQDGVKISGLLRTPTRIQY